MELEKKPRVAYYHDDEIGTHLYVQLGQYHPLKPLRVQMTDELIEVYGMKKYVKEFVILPTSGSHQFPARTAHFMATRISTSPSSTQRTTST